MCARSIRTTPTISSHSWRTACSVPETSPITVCFSVVLRASARTRCLNQSKHAVGPWNFSEVSPIQLLGRFNGFVRSVILRVSEARDLGEGNRFAAYEHMKTLCAAPPDTLRVDEKNLREHYVMNCLRRHHHDRTTRLMASICQPMIGALMSRGPI